MKLNYSNNIMNLKETQIKYLLIRDGQYAVSNTECGGQQFEHCSSSLSISGDGWLQIK
jgi:hypothetical protein